MNEHTAGTATFRKLPLCLLCLALALGACVRTAPVTAPEPVATPPLAVTFLPQKGDFISKYGDRVALAEITAIAKGYDYIILGEGHRNPIDHKVQQVLLQALSESGDGLSLGLEMVAVDKQQELDDFCKGQVTLDALPGELQWDEKWGYDFAMFRDHFAIAKQNGVPVAGLNVPSEVTRKISREGLEALTDEERALLPREIVPPSTDQKTFLNAIMELHRDRDADDPAARERFYLVQSIWDSKMAEEAVALRAKFDWPVLVVAGSAHAEYGWGIAKRIRWMEPGARVLTIVPWRGGGFDSEEGDYFFYAPDSYRSRMGMTLAGQIGGGIVVESVERGSRADRAGLRPGDLLTDASGVPLDDLYDLHMAGTKVHDADEPLVFTVRRGGDTLSVDMGKLGQAKPGTKSEEDTPSPEMKPDTATEPAVSAATEPSVSAATEPAVAEPALAEPAGPTPGKEAR
ncbi:MAG: ChaN family lipoprotein [Pseudodesulfovibrio sp.]|uniref:ChaN family lipoprotein n=1 Tax=Pseudodesulfovibrio sp. TaxID=2035812 RepID=UPI003D0DD236